MCVLRHNGRPPLSDTISVDATNFKIHQTACLFYLQSSDRFTNKFDFIAAEFRVHLDYARRRRYKLSEFSTTIGRDDRGLSMFLTCILTTLIHLPLGRFIILRHYRNSLPFHRRFAPLNSHLVFHPLKHTFFCHILSPFMFHGNRGFKISI